MDRPATGSQPRLTHNDNLLGLTGIPAHFVLQTNCWPWDMEVIDVHVLLQKLDVQDVIQTVPQTWNRMALPSMFGGGTPPLESFGWQLDDPEIWDGLPDPAKRAESPSPQQVPRRL